jgi:hypothetical protein
VKIDVEGAELDVLKGMKDTMNPNIKIILEVHPDLLFRLGQNVSEITNLVRSYNFKIYSISESGLINESQILSDKRAHYLIRMD